MKLTRVYDQDDKARFEADLAEKTAEWTATLQAQNVPARLVDEMARKCAAAEVAPVTVIGYAVEHTGATRDQHFSVGFVTDCVLKGLMTISGDELTLTVQPESLHYEILRTPGRYCLHCNEKLENDELGELARLHVALNHAGVASPDPNQPAGYEAINYYDCLLDATQHEQYKFGGA